MSINVGILDFAVGRYSLDPLMTTLKPAFNQLITSIPMP